MSCSINVPPVTVIIPTYGEKGVQLTYDCVNSLIETHEHIIDQIEIIVVQDEENSEVYDLLDTEFSAFDHLPKIITRPNGGFAKACNTGIKEASGQIVFLVNNDIEFREPTLQYMSDACFNLGMGLVGTRLLYPDDTVQHGGVAFVPTPEGPLPGYFDHVARGLHRLHTSAVTMRRNCLVTGALIGIPRYTLDTAGLLDERFEFSAEDIDYCLKVFETGRDVLYFGYTYAIHKEGATRGKTPEEKMLLAPDVAEKEQRSLAFLFEKWPGVDWGFWRI